MASELAYRPLAITKTLIKRKKTGEFIPTGYVSLINTYVGSKRGSKIKPKQLGHKRNFEFIKHPRISPNGEWLTYYTMGMYDQKGAFVVHLPTMKVTRLSTTYDKHPTWSPDGTKILFHYSKNIAGIEHAYLGYFDLELENGKVKSSKRVMLDDPNKKGYSYHKHPAMYAGTDLVFFHAETKVDGKKKLMVRRLVEGSKIYYLKVYEKGERVEKVKHPATAMNQSGVFFIGKNKGEDHYRVYKMNDDTVVKIDSKAL